MDAWGAKQLKNNSKETPGDELGVYYYKANCFKFI